MAWSNSVVTNAGLALMADVLAGAEMTITMAALGEGTCDVAALMAQTKLTAKNDTATVNIAATENLREGIGKSIRLQIRNTGMDTSVVAKQFGLYAKTTGDEVLFAIMQDDTGEEIPSEAEYPDFMLEFTAAVALSQTEGITVTVSGSSIVTAEDLQNAIDNHKHTVFDIEDFPESLPADGGNADTVNGHTVEADVPTNARFTDTTYSSGAGISISGTTINNSGVRSVSSGSSNGTIKANINGTETDVAVKGLASAAYQAVQTVASTVGLHRISSGSDEATTANCPAGCWRGQYE